MEPMENNHNDLNNGFENDLEYNPEIRKDQKETISILKFLIKKHFFRKFHYIRT
jgi:hypothetical protein